MKRQKTKLNQMNILYFAYYYSFKLILARKLKTKKVVQSKTSTTVKFLNSNKQKIKLTKDKIKTTTATTTKELEY